MPMPSGLIRWSETPDPLLRLICFPHAGGGASTYREWPRDLPPEVDVWAVAYPGRESRFHDPLPDDLTSLASEIVDNLLHVADLPYAFFGHSMGGIISLEVAEQLRQQKRLEPWAMYVSGHGVPCPACQSDPVSQLDDEAFLQRIQSIGGTSAEVLANPELVELILPVLRSDIGMCERYRCEQSRPLNCRMIAFGGADDPHVTVEDMERWSERTTGRFDFYDFPGGHFYLRDSSTEVLRIISDDLQPDIDRVDCTWTDIGNPFPLGSGECHLWALQLDLVDEVLNEVSSCLSVEERELAETYRLPTHARRALASRGLLRHVLASYIDTSPDRLMLELGPFGKPSLKRNAGKPHIEFNLTHADGFGLVAVTLGGASVGVDLERVRPLSDEESMLQRVLTPDERGTLKQEPQVARMERFFELWTAKEALLKATGLGLSVGPERIELSLRAGIAQLSEAWELTGVPEEFEIPLEDWHLRVFSPFAGYRAAIAVSRSDEPSAEIPFSSTRLLTAAKSAIRQLASPLPISFRKP